ncbi:hypothetical protein ACHAW6_008568 [Cyclotella cf. meneghiniana]
MNINLANFNLMTPLKQPKFAKITLSDIPEVIILEYNLYHKATSNGGIYIWCRCSMYSLPQTGSLGHNLLEQNFNKAGYCQSQIVPGLWKHDTRPIQFTLIVDDFGVKYSWDGPIHLIDTLKQHYNVSVDTTGQEYVKINLDWDYDNGEVHLSMTPFCKKALNHLDTITPSIHLQLWSNNTNNTNQYISAS